MTGNLHCAVCGEWTAEADGGGNLKLYVHLANHNARIDLKDILKAFARSEKGMMILREFFDEGFAEFITR